MLGEERKVDTTFFDAGRHQPLPFPDDPDGDEIRRLNARVAELEAALDRAERLAATVCEGYWGSLDGQQERIAVARLPARVAGLAAHAMSPQDETNIE